MTELIKKILKWLGIAVGAYVCLALIIFAVTMIASAINPAEPTSKVAVVDQTNMDVEEESKEDTVVEEELEKETTTTEEQEEDTSISEPESNEEKTGFITKAKDKINEIKSEYEKEQNKKNEIHPNSKEEVSELAKKCFTVFRSPKDKYLDKLKQYDKDIVIENFNGWLSYAAEHATANTVDTGTSEKVVTAYNKIYGETETMKALQKAIDKYSKLEKDCPSESKLKKIKHNIEFKTECLEESSWKTFYFYKREDADDIDWNFLTWGDSIYYAKDEDGSAAALLSNENYSQEGEYRVLCRIVQETGLTMTDISGFETNDVPVYADTLHLEKEIDELQSEVDIEKKLKKARKQLIKLMKKGL